METANTQQLLLQTQDSLGLSANICANLKALLEFLPHCEWALISYMDERGIWVGPLPAMPSGYDEAEASVDFGLFPYWINNPTLIQNTTISNFIINLKWYEAITLKLLVPTGMNATNYDLLCNQTAPLVYTDGSILNTMTYATYDQGWFAAFFNMAKTLMNSWWYNGHNFPMPTKPVPIPISSANGNANTVTIAMVGDWGSGDANAVAVMQQVQALDPDYIIHLGDVYYAGTPLLTDPNGGSYIGPNQEQDNLLNLWPAADTKGNSYTGRSFTLNSNHEMYSGGNGLFLDALKANATPVGAGSVFSAQNGMSCFALTFGGWTILALDTAFNAEVTNAFMFGNLDGDSPVQTSWIKQLKLDPQKTIVLTHHTGFAFDCGSSYSLWDNVKTALGDDPFAWYWGHQHSGIVYSETVTIPISKNQPTEFTTKTLTRCVGHSGLPYGYTLGIQKGCTNVEWQVAQNDNPIPTGLLPNGFVLLTLQTDRAGVLNKITEAFYDTGKDAQPTFTKVILG